MYDFSAEAVRQRPAQTGDVLVTAPISQHTNGLVDPGDPETAVCLMPGTKLTIRGLSDEFLGDHSLAGPEQRATFAQYAPNRTLDFRDYVHFTENGAEVKVHNLPSGTTVTVESVPMAAQMVIETPNELVPT